MKKINNNISQFRNGDILLVDTSSFLGKTIDKFQGNRFNHAGFILNVFETCYVVEAVDTGVGFTELSEYLTKYNNGELDLLILRDVKSRFFYIDTQEIIKFILPKTKLSYHYSNLFIFQPIKYIAKKLFGKELWIGPKKVVAEEQFICGEWVAFVYNHFTGLFDNWNKVAPVDLYDNYDFVHLTIAKTPCTYFCANR